MNTEPINGRANALEELGFGSLSNWMEYDHADKFSFVFLANGIAFCSE